MAPRRNYYNRELSWLEFNQRVLDEAINKKNPLLERLKFLAITASNLDEFFMVRVGGLKPLARQGSEKTDAAGLTPAEQLRRVRKRVAKMVRDQYQCLLREIEQSLAAHGLVRESPNSLDSNDLEQLETYFVTHIEPILSPIAVGRHRRMPLLRSLGLHVMARLRPGTRGRRASRFAVIPIDVALDRIVRLPAGRGFRYILLEDVIRLFASRLFGGEKVLECVAFRIARNADMAVDEDGDVDLLAGMEEVLQRRRKAPCVRLEIEAKTSDECLRFIKRELELDDEDVYAIRGPVCLSDFMKIAQCEAGFGSLKRDPWLPRHPVCIDPQKNMFEIISRRDVLLSHPYESYQPVVDLIQQAADDADVLAIKMTLYRTSEEGLIVEALGRAARAGKYVTALIELKARFDEHRNILWARKLEEDGVHVVHGVYGLKTHAKICLIVRREQRGIVRYMHFGTGNYNESTARQYSDISLMTKDDDLGRDATTFFNAVTGYSVMQRFRKLSMAPSGLRETLLGLIRDETERAKRHQRAAIWAKMNSLADETIIAALYQASRAGVQIRLNVRGICCLRPGVKNLSEQVTVVSVVDRFLEHSRIFYFAHGGEERVYISSADWMPRNLDRRIELLIPIEDPAHRKRLIGMLDTYLRDSVKGREILADGRYRVRTPEAGALSSQEQLYREACDAEREMLHRRRTVFQPHQTVS